MLAELNRRCEVAPEKIYREPGHRAGTISGTGSPGEWCRQRAIGETRSHSVATTLFVCGRLSGDHGCERLSRFQQLIRLSRSCDLPR